MFSSTIEKCPVDKFEIERLTELDGSVYLSDSIKMKDATTIEIDSDKGFISPKRV